MTHEATERGSSSTPRKRLRRVARVLRFGLLLLVALLVWGVARYRLHEVSTEALVPFVRPGDTILVRRVDCRDADPARWDVVLVPAANASSGTADVRRVIGLAGEHVRIVRGGLWSRTASTWRRERRPEALRDEGFVAVYPLDGVALDPLGAFECEGAWRVVGPGHLRFGGGGVARAYYADAITTTSRADVPSAVGERVDDIRLRFDLTPAGSSDVEIAWRAPIGLSVLLTLSTRDGPRAQGLRLERRAAVSTQTWSEGLRRGETTRLGLDVVDGEVIVRLDDRVVQRAAFGLAAPLEELIQPQVLGLGARGDALEVDRLRIEQIRGWRATPRLQRQGGFQVPDRAILVTGDPSAPDALGAIDAVVPWKEVRGRADRILWPWSRRGRVR